MSTWLLAARRLLTVAGLASLMQLASGPVAVLAQRTDLAEERVRADLADGGQIEGTVVDWAEKSLSLRVSPDSVWSAAWVDVAEVRRHRRGRQARRGLGLGLAIGGLGAGLVTAVVVDPCDETRFCIGPDSRMEAFMVGGLVGAALGGVAGLLIGSAFTTSSWEPLVIPGPNTSFSVGTTFRVFD